MGAEQRLPSLGQHARALSRSRNGDPALHARYITALGCRTEDERALSHLVVDRTERQVPRLGHRERRVDLLDEQLHVVPLAQVGDRGQLVPAAHLDPRVLWAAPTAGTNA